MSSLSDSSHLAPRAIRPFLANQRGPAATRAKERGLPAWQPSWFGHPVIAPASHGYSDASSSASTKAL